MAQLTSRANLSAARHPLVSAWAGRTVMVSERGDTHFQKSAIFAGADADRDVGIPQVFYMHNAMPTEQGYQSVGYETVIQPVVGEINFDQVSTLVDSEGNKFLYVPAAGRNYVFDAPVLAWASLNTIANIDDNVIVTTAFVQGETYIFYERKKCMKYDRTTKQFVDVTLAGLVVTNIVGITSSNGYLLCWDIDDTLYWSSATDPLDFVPSLLTGAGSGAITDLKGRLIVIVPITNGFIAYGSGNAIGGSFTGNLRFPFALKEVPGSGGVRDKEHISYESNLEKHYALTSVGLQSLTKTGAETILPETSDFLTNRVFEDFNDATKTWTLQNLNKELYIKLSIIGSRYFVVSYGVAELTHALVYDIAYKKWGKLKITHVDCFQYTSPNLYGEITYAMLNSLGTTYDDLIDTMYTDLSNSVATAERPRRTIGFLQRDGTVKVLRFDHGQLDHSGVFLLGKYQITRGHNMQLLGFEIENVDQGSNWAVWVLTSLDGKNFQPAVAPTLKGNSGYLRAYQIRKTGINHSLLFTGSFNLVSVQITYAPAGMVRTV